MACDGGGVCGSCFTLSSFSDFFYKYISFITIFTSSLCWHKCSYGTWNKIACSVILIALSALLFTTTNNETPQAGVNSHVETLPVNDRVRSVIVLLAFNRSTYITDAALEPTCNGETRDASLYILRALEKRWTKCISVAGDIVEK